MSKSTTTTTTSATSCAAETNAASFTTACRFLAGGSNVLCIIIYHISFHSSWHFLYTFRSSSSFYLLFQLTHFEVTFGFQKYWERWFVEEFDKKLPERTKFHEFWGRSNHKNFDVFPSWLWVHWFIPPHPPKSRLPRPPKKIGRRKT